MRSFFTLGIFIIILLAQLIPIDAMAQDWASSPNNWQNNEKNWENSSKNWKNSPNNWENSPSKWGNERIVRDKNGNAAGYAVPKQDGGVNLYDSNVKTPVL